MALAMPPLQPLSCWKAFLRKQPRPYRLLTTTSLTPRVPQPPPSRLPYNQIPSSIPKGLPPPSPPIITNKTPILASKPPIKTYPPPPSARRRFPHAIEAVTASHLTTLDPTGSRQRLFSRTNPDAPQPGDILLATFKNGDPFAGVCLSIRRRGIDTSILLRNRLMMTGVEMWVKIYSPNVTAVEVVKRAEKRARRARLYYMRYYKRNLSISHLFISNPPTPIFYHSAKKNSENIPRKLQQFPQNPPPQKKYPR